jgi:threonine dehydrogenase-like Zn-dependent dehydrogenase
MQIRSIVFEGVKQTSFKSEEGDLVPAEHGAIVQALYTCVSAGTELAKFSGLQEIAFPSRMGNRFVGRVIELGHRCDAFEVGDLVFCHAYHTSHSQSTELTVKLPIQASPFHRHTQQGHVSILAERIASGRLNVEPLVSSVGSPADCQDTYLALLENKETMLSAVFDWR